MRILFPVILILGMAGAWISTAYRNLRVPEEYKNVISSAYEAYEAGYYREAQELLGKARELQGAEAGYEAQSLQRDIYYGMQDGDSYERQLLAMIRDYPEQEENYEKLIGYYRNTKDMRALCEYLPEYLALWPENESIRQADEELNAQYEYVMTGYYDVRYASRSLVDVQEEEYEIIDEAETVSRKLVNSMGNTVFDGGYTQMSVAQNGSCCFVCDKEGQWMSVDIRQNLLARNEDVNFSYIGSLAENNIATAVIDGKYRFVNNRMKVSDKEWEDAGTFRNGINGVKQNGRWALVTTESWMEVADFPYKDIPRNSQDCCVAQGYGVVADDKGYYVIGTEELAPVSENVYEELKAFESSQPTAYRSGDKWGFVNKYGEIYIEACYEDAFPFINGYAAVKQNGLWGYIDRNGTMVVEPRFQEALHVLENGYAYVKNEFGYWDYVIIDRLYYTDRG